jgi:hypothetical protein
MWLILFFTISKNGEKIPQKSLILFCFVLFLACFKKKNFLENSSQIKKQLVCLFSHSFSVFYLTIKTRHRSCIVFKQQLSIVFTFLRRQGILNSEMLAGEQTYNGEFTLDVKSV